MFKDFFTIDINSPTGLRWKVSRGRCKAGDVAGFLWCHPKKKNNQYYRVRFNNKNYKVHRIIWTIIYGSIPENKIIDHIDGNTLNNNQENLRLVSYTGNNSNKRKSSNNTTGFSGVSWTTTNEGNLYAVAAVRFNNVNCRKNFSVSKLGIMKAFYLACKWVRSRQTIVKQTSDEAFTDRHGY